MTRMVPRVKGKDIVIANEHKSCYGTMIPVHVGNRAGETSKGKAFTLTILPSAGLGIPKSRVEVDPDEWDDCLRCGEFDHCHKLCMARLALFTAGSV